MKFKLTKKDILFGTIVLALIMCLISISNSRKSSPELQPPKEEVAEPEVKKEVVFKGTFLEILKKAKELVSAECPSVELFEADAVINEIGMTAADVIGWKFIYNFPHLRTAFIEYKDSAFSNVTVIDEPWMEDCIIHELKMDLVEAIKLMRKAKYNDKFMDLTVRWPLYPGCKEPFYIFSCPEQGWVFVGTVSKKVKLEPFR